MIKKQRWFLTIINGEIDKASPIPSPREGKLCGAASNVRRIVEVMGAIGFTHHFYSMSPEQIAEVLPSEFDVWKN